MIFDRDHDHVMTLTESKSESLFLFGSLSGAMGLGFSMLRLCPWAEVGRVCA